MKLKLQPGIARLTLGFIGMLSLAAVTNAARYDGAFTNNTTSFRFENPAANLFESGVAFDLSQAVTPNRNNRQLVRWDRAPVQRIDLQPINQVLNLGSFDRFITVEPSRDGQFKLYELGGTRLQNVAVFSVGATRNFLFTNANQSTSINFNRNAFRSGLKDFNPDFRKEIS